MPPSGPSIRRHYALSAHLGRRFGAGVRKIPLDAGFGCPNRDGTLSRTGCVFCNPEGSGTGLFAKGLSLAEQWERLPVRGKRPGVRYLAYLQAFSNTHGPVERVRAVVDEASALPGAAGLCLGTRPDCLDDAKLDAIAACPLPLVQLDLGLQSADDTTLTRIHRHHSAEDFARAARAAAERGIEVCAHLVAGLPGEGEAALLASIDFLNALPVAGVKFHNCYVCRNTPLAGDWEREDYRPPALEDYARWTARALARLRPEVVVHRLVADPAPGELLAPAWAADKNAALTAVRSALAEDDLWQGKHAPDTPCATAPPPWFDPGNPPPPGEDRP